MRSPAKTTACPCGKRHTQKAEYEVGDQIRVRVHWRHYHRTGRIVAKRPGWNEGAVYDVDLDSNDSGPAHITAMLASELWEVL